MNGPETILLVESQQGCVRATVKMLVGMAERHMDILVPWQEGEVRTNLFFDISLSCGTVVGACVLLGSEHYAMLRFWFIAPVRSLPSSRSSDCPSHSRSSVTPSASSPATCECVARRKELSFRDFGDALALFSTWRPPLPPLPHKHSRIQRTPSDCTPLLSPSTHSYLTEEEAREGYQLWLSELPKDERDKADALLASGVGMVVTMHKIHSARGGRNGGTLCDGDDAASAAGDISVCVY